MHPKNRYCINSVTVLIVVQEAMGSGLQVLNEGSDCSEFEAHDEVRTLGRPLNSREYRQMKLMLTTALLATSIAVGAVYAQDGGTVEKIRETGSITLGHRDVSIPFSYLDDQQKPIGFAMDLCGKIVEAVSAELGTEVETELQPIQLSNQIPLIQNGTVDIICGPATNTLERQQAVAFSHTIFVSSIRAVVPAASPVQKFADLNGKPVSLTTGSTSIELLAKRAADEGFTTSNVLNPDHAASFLALTTGRADAFVMDDILLAGLVARSDDPSAWRILDDNLRQEPYGLIIRKDDPEFKALVDETIDGLMASGEFQTIYDKWFATPIPPQNINLQFPLNDALAALVANPNDEGV